MSRCDDYEPLIERMLAEEIGNAERDRLLAHTEGCTGCREFVDLHYRLQDPELGVDLPDEAEFASVRRAVMHRVRAESPSRTSAGTRVFGWFQALVQQPVYLAAAAAIWLLTLSVVFVAGQRSGGLDDTFARGPVVVDQWMQQIRDEARSNRRLVDVENSPYVYSNVAMQDMADDTISLSFDVTRHMEVAKPRHDPLVKEVLAQSLINPTPLGTRLEMISYASKMTDPKIEQALIFSMLNDPVLAVRSRALSILSTYEASEGIRDAFTVVLSGDESVQMRMLAMDYLAATEVGRAQMEDVLQELPREDQALWIKAERFTR